MKYSESFTKLYPSVFTVVCLVASMGLLAYSLRFLPLGTAYGIWTGIGAVGTAIAGILLFDEPKDAARIFFILLICTGIVGLKLVTKE